MIFIKNSDTVEPGFNKVAGDLPNLFVKSRIRYIENLDITNLRGNDQNVRYIEDLFTVDLISVYLPSRVDIVIRYIEVDFTFGPLDYVCYIELSEILGEHCQGHKSRRTNKVSDFDAFCYASLFHDFIANACSFNAGNL
ncbi:hypothetical protein P5673_026608 [Acropora cervicornis]|uniref:Uncharacterized protein n=1 Tax=Acropora cervicornis TaxID=6130 RepID=A0AAD9Q0A1_ACRCE|nr:hypothetical protein P5673_026608 [Acropora cervicornis]